MDFFNKIKEGGNKSLKGSGAHPIYCSSAFAEKFWKLIYIPIIFTWYQKRAGFTRACSYYSPLYWITTFLHRQRLGVTKGPGVIPLSPSHFQLWPEVLHLMRKTTPLHLGPISPVMCLLAVSSPAIQATSMPPSLTRLTHPWQTPSVLSPVLHSSPITSKWELLPHVHNEGSPNKWQMLFIKHITTTVSWRLL